MLLAVSFVPLEDVAKAFDELSEMCPNALIPVLDYWEDNFIGRRRRNRRAQPRFAATVWNVRERVEDSLPKTNNSACWRLASRFPVVSGLPSSDCIQIN